MAVTYIDYEIQENIFSTDEAKVIFDEKARMQRWLNIEAKLAEVQAELGIIPSDAADEIKKNADINKLNHEKIKEGYKKGKNSIIPVIRALSEQCANGYGEYVHFGITTQDVVDTGQMLEIKEVIAIVYRDARHLEAILMALVEQYGMVPMIGRTHGQYALPITFGLKVIVWLSEIRRHIERIKAMVPRILVGQLSGPVGTLSALGDKANLVSKLTLERLGLGYNYVSWHVARDNIAEFSMCLSMLTNTLAKIANEIFQLSKTDVQEMEEYSAETGAMSSSAMPHKNNPVLSQRVVVIARHVRALSGIVMESMIHESERDPRSLWSEWLSIPQISIYSIAALSNAIKLLGEIKIYPEKMQANLKKYGEYIASEHLMIKFSKLFGKMSSQKKLHELIQRSRLNNLCLLDEIESDSAFGMHIDQGDIDIIKNPGSYIGHTKDIIENAIKITKQCRELENESLF